MRARLACEVYTARGVTRRASVCHLDVAAGGGNIKRPYGEAMAKLIDDEVKAIVDEAHRRTMALLEERRSELEVRQHAAGTRARVCGSARRGLAACLVAGSNPWITPRLCSARARVTHAAGPRLQAVAELLMEKEKINADDVQKLIGVMRARAPLPLPPPRSRLLRRGRPRGLSLSIASAAAASTPAVACPPPLSVWCVGCRRQATGLSRTRAASSRSSSGRMRRLWTT